MDNTLFWVNDEDKKFSIVHVVEEYGENAIVKPTPNSLFPSVLSNELVSLFLY